VNSFTDLFNINCTRGCYIGTYLVEGTKNHIGLECGIQICNCFLSTYTEPCSKTTNPCGCKSAFCGGELCNPAQLTPWNDSGKA